MIWGHFTYYVINFLKSRTNFHGPRPPQFIMDIGNNILEAINPPIGGQRLLHFLGVKNYYVIQEHSLWRTVSFQSVWIHLWQNLFSQENGDYKLVCVPAHRLHKYICPTQLKLSIYDCVDFWPLHFLIFSIFLA